MKISHASRPESYNQILFLLALLTFALSSGLESDPPTTLPKNMNYFIMVEFPLDWAVKFPWFSDAPIREAGGTTYC